MFNIFKTSESQKRLLVERAQLLGSSWTPFIEASTDRIIRLLNQTIETESHTSQTSKKMDAGTESRLFAEVLAFYLHYVWRTALDTLGNKKGDIFMEALFVTTLSAAAESKKADDTIQTMFYDFYADFDLAHCKLKGEVFLWEFSKRLSNIANSQKGPIKEPFHLMMIQRFLMEDIICLCLPTLINPKKSRDDWQKDLREAERKISDDRQKLQRRLDGIISERPNENDTPDMPC